MKRRMMPAGASFAPVRKIKVLIADDHAAVRHALTHSLEAEGSVVVIGGAEDGEEAVALAQKLRPEVVIMDVHMPRLNGIEATRQLTAKFPGLKVIGFTLDHSGALTSAMRAAGAVDCVDKSLGLQGLIAAIHAGEAVSGKFNGERGRTASGPRVIQGTRLAKFVPTSFQQ